MLRLFCIPLQVPLSVKESTQNLDKEQKIPAKKQNSKNTNSEIGRNATALTYKDKKE